MSLKGTDCFYLKRINTELVENKIIPFKNDSILIGRSQECNYKFLHNAISRQHARFIKIGEVWKVECLSAQGIYVNSRLIPKGIIVELNLGCIIQFGQSDLYTYQFLKKIFSKKKEANLSDVNLSNDLSKEHCKLEMRLKELESHRDNLLKERNTMSETLQIEIEQLENKFNEEMKNIELMHKEDISIQQSLHQEKENLGQQLKEKFEEMEKKYEEEKLNLNEKLREEEKNKYRLLDSNQESLRVLEQEKLKLENILQEEQNRHQQQLETERLALQGVITNLQDQQQKLEKEVENKAEMLKRQEEERSLIENEKKIELEVSLKKTEMMMSRLKEVESNLEEKIILTSTLEVEAKDKENVCKRLDEVLKERKDLEKKLDDAVKEGEKVTDLKDALNLLEAQKLSLEQEITSATKASESVRKELVENVTDVLENEFQCAVCSELFISAIMLQCGHTFCQFCINSWKKNKKNCPSCRTPIISETRSIVVDNFIDKIVETLSKELKERRNEVISERKAEITKDAEKVERERAARAEAAANRRGRRGGRRNRGANNRGGRGANNYGWQRNNMINGILPPNYTPPVITIDQGIPPPMNQYSTNTVPPIINPIGAPGPSSNNIYHEISSSSNSRSSSNSSAHSNSDSSSAEGLGMNYYGGYGRCYCCGRRGHWANDCPDS